MIRIAAFCAVLLGFPGPPAELQGETVLTQDPETVTRAAPSVDPALLAWMRKLASDARVQGAQQLLRARDEEITALQIRFAEIPAPDYRAADRARELARCLVEAGLTDVHLNAAGNVLGVLPGSVPGEPVVVLSAHLDTVFSDLDSLHVERQGSVLRGPGVSDDAAGLAAVVHLARALREARVPLRRDIVVVGTVGEEGEGDLRGVKDLLANDLPPARLHAFLTLDLGSRQQLVNEGLGSRRLRVVLLGPGGHSWADFGRPNPIHALARAIDDFVATPLPSGVRSSFNVGTIAGGRGVNVIPEEASLRLDLRSESSPVLEEIERAFRQSLRRGIEREEAWARTDDLLRAEVEVIGERPVGRTPPDQALVRTALAAFAAQGMTMALGASSTDANLPMSLGVPAIGMPHGVLAHDVHSRNEWCDVQGRQAVLEAEIVALVALAELVGPPQPRRGLTD